MLFLEVKGPQHPYERCRMPDSTNASIARNRRKLRGMSIEMAEEACVGIHGEDFDLCVTDVLTTGDRSIAEDYD